MRCPWFLGAFFIVFVDINPGGGKLRQEVKGQPQVDPFAVLEGLWALEI